MDILGVGNRILHFQWRPELLGIVQRYFSPLYFGRDSGDADHCSGKCRKLIGFPPEP